MDDLALFMRHAASQTIRYGAWDCCLMCADWFRFRRGDDPAATWRGHYSTFVGAMRLIYRNGGIDKLFASGLEPLGASRRPVGEIARGDIVAGWQERSTSPVGGISLGSMIMIAAGEGRGIILRDRERMEIVAAWRV
jgi:hypothetical protein